MLDLALAFHRIGRPRILIVGDYLFDQEVHCEPSRFAQEGSHCPVWKRVKNAGKVRPGGAGAVEEMALALGADVILATAQTQAASKCRYFVGDVQVMRIDTDPYPLSGADTDRLASHVADEVQRADVCLIADYGKGVCTEAVLRAAIDGAKACCIPCIADPHEHQWVRYKGATCLKMNARQAEAQRRGLDACLTFPAIVITHGGEGIGLGRQKEGDEYYLAHSRQVVDVTGAGDMVLATLGVCIAGMSWPDACRVANSAAGLKVERRGAAPVPKCKVIADLLHGIKIIPDELLSPVVAAAKLRGAVVWSNGCHDGHGLHRGHLHSLAEAKKQGDVLIVGVNGDRSVKSLKGMGRPISPITDRMEAVAALACVDYVVEVQDDEHLAKCLERVAPDVLVKGDDWRGKDIVGSENAGRVHFVERLVGYSTTRFA